MGIIDKILGKDVKKVKKGARYHNNLCEELETYLLKGYENTKVYLIETGDFYRSMEICLGSQTTPVGLLKRNQENGTIAHIFLYDGSITSTAQVMFDMKKDPNKHLEKWVGKPLEDIPNPMERK